MIYCSKVNFAWLPPSIVLDLVDIDWAMEVFLIKFTKVTFIVN